jgi:hypothetical protein
MMRAFYRIAPLLLAVAATWPVPSQARDGGRETREVKEAREVREARQDRETRESGRREGDRSGSDHLDGDRAQNDDREEGDDRNGSNRSGSGDNRGRSAAVRARVERDTRGGDRLRDEVLMLAGDAEAQSVRRAGFEVIAERRLESMRQNMLRIRVHDGERVERVMERLRSVAPGARVAPNHVFRPSGASPVRSGVPEPVAVAMAAPTVGIIDTGADRTSAALAGRVVRVQGFAPGGYLPRAHGTTVAQLATARGARLAVADVFGLDQSDALAASADRIAAGIDWLRSQQIRVINISIEGPDNLVLGYVIEQAVGNGVAIVAAAGNDGPAARAVFPAAYPGVIAVTAVDERGEVYRRAARGSYVQFAARGVFRRGELPADGVSPAIAGTSFAAPTVAAVLAARWDADRNATREQVLAVLRTEALDKGVPGRDPVYGWGVISSSTAAMAAHSGN